MVEQGVSACAMEVSSHALVMGRVAGVVFDVAAFLNLGRDHLDFHSDVEDYFAAKASLFTPERSRRGLTNVDDPFGRRLLDEAGVPMVTFSPSGQPADWRAEDVVLEPEGSTFTVVTPEQDRIPAGVPLTGGFNVANALCAIALAGEAGLDPRLVATGIARTRRRTRAARAHRRGPGLPRVRRLRAQAGRRRGRAGRRTPADRAAGCCSSSVPAATATSASGRSWARSAPGSPTCSS